MRSFLLALAGMLIVSAIGGYVLSRELSSRLDGWLSGEGLGFDPGRFEELLGL